MRIKITPWMLTLLVVAFVLCACAPPKPARYQTAPLPPLPKAPTPISMAGSLAMGLWSSNFGAVKIEPDPTGGEGATMGVWLYERGGQEVIGYFAGKLRGNVLEFNWHEYGQPSDLTGAGYISFQSDGKGFAGRWWSHDRRRNGLFSGERDEVTAAPPGAPAGQPDPTPPSPDDETL